MVNYRFLFYFIYHGHFFAQAEHFIYRHMMHWYIVCSQQSRFNIQVQNNKVIHLQTILSALILHHHTKRMFSSPSSPSICSILNRIGKYFFVFFHFLYTLDNTIVNQKLLILKNFSHFRKQSVRSFWSNPSSFSFEIELLVLTTRSIVTRVLKPTLSAVG